MSRFRHLLADLELLVLYVITQVSFNPHRSKTR
jgi:hypothetical protein